MARVDPQPLADGAQRGSAEPLADGAVVAKDTKKESVSYFTEFSAGLTVSFVAMSLGAAFGVASQRGPLAGILSAGFIALITSLFGGTVVQCSGPTAPMTAVSTTVVAGAAHLLGLGEAGTLPRDLPAVADQMLADQFINLVFMLTGVLLIIGGICRIGKLITLVPKIVISGFMNGIAIQIWLGEAQKVFGFGGKVAYEGGLAVNIAVTLVTFAIVFGLPKFLDAMGKGNLKKFLPSTLIGIVFVTAVCIPLSQLQHVQVGDPINSFSKVTDMFVEGAPRDWSLSTLVLALPGALNLLMLCYLDTLLTSLVMDQKVGEKYGESGWRPTNQNFELMSQGVANGFCAMFGGLPGAQATIRSVLILNEGAKTRLAGIMVGIFVIAEMIALQSLIGMIPSAVFSGVLLKVGYDVLDWPPAWTYIKTMLLKRPHPNGPNDVHVAHIDMLFVLGTTLVTVFVNLNVAVAAFTLLFFLGRLVMDIPDMKTTSELKEVPELDNRGEP